MSKKLFGTDGIRGIANDYPLTPEMVQRIGMAYGTYLKAKGKNEKVVIGKDTRLSSDMISSSFASGLNAVGINVVNVGVTTTPSISFLVRRFKFSGGVMISASHNPCQYNGLKFFNDDGKKFSEIQELSLEAVIFTKYDIPRALPEKIGTQNNSCSLIDTYEKFIESCGTYLSGMRIAIDCANGSASSIAPKVFSDLGANIYSFNDKPNGRNINENCGAISTDFISQKVRELNADIGFAYDGDADRCIAIDENGRVIDGDMLIAALAVNYSDKSKTVVSTIMSNLGLELFLNSVGLNLIRTPVGDRQVSEEMNRQNAVVGGEQSGHIIVRQFMETGDGILTSVLISSIVKKANKPVSKVVNLFKPFPQKVKSFKVKVKKPIENLKEVGNAIYRSNEMLKGKGRLVVRYSGTEPLVRLMVEAESAEIIDRIIGEIHGAFLREGILDENS